MVRMMGGDAVLGVVVGIAMVGLGLTEHLPLFAAFGAYVGLVSLWRLVEHARAGDRTGGP